MFSKSKKPSATEQRIPSNPAGKDQSSNEPDDNLPLEQHLFVTATGAIVESEAIINLGTEDVSQRVTKQVAFGDASGMQIKGGFFGAGSQSVALKIAENHLQRQTAQDSMKMKLEMERLEIQRRQLELAERRFQFEREKQLITNQQSNATSGQPKKEEELVLESFVLR
ncbi:hypothetical protein D9619_011297 [Psilocybe cf. subviscida]|uniref:Uncharacterized protein n=1 Tax=Psilocybe cf. subviscida TaxID=2480587 RepID=A0A8H5F5C7_9AGAR|nr:hypothetical protein D9619_011297 [Psilocybe cf. subviscida]